MKRGRGRPPLEAGENRPEVHLRLTSRDYDAVCALATADRVTVPEVVRRAVAGYVDARVPRGVPRRRVTLRRPVGI